MIKEIQLSQGIQNLMSEFAAVDFLVFILYVDHKLSSWRLHAQGHTSHYIKFYCSFEVEPFSSESVLLVSVQCTICDEQANVLSVLSELNGKVNFLSFTKF